MKKLSDFYLQHRTRTVYDCLWIGFNDTWNFKRDDMIIKAFGYTLVLTKSIPMDSSLYKREEIK